MSLFAIADLHLSLGEDKPMDVFRGWDNYVDRLKENWQKIVTDDDTVVIAGDISWAMKLEETKTDFEFINSLSGKKLLLKGNHDYWWNTKNKMDGWLSQNSFDTMSILFNNAYRVGDYCVCGTRGWFIEAEGEDDKKVLAREVGRLQMSLDMADNLGGEKVVFLHYPPIYGGSVCDEIMDVLVSRSVKKCYYGHIHGRQNINNAFEGEYEGINFKLISCDKLAFAPMLVR